MLNGNKIKKEKKKFIFPYNSKVNCECCGSGDISLKYRSPKINREEHIKKTCTVCKYVWREKPKWTTKLKEL